MLGGSCQKLCPCAILLKRREHADLADSQPLGIWPREKAVQRRESSLWSGIDESEMPRVLPTCVSGAHAWRKRRPSRAPLEARLWCRQWPAATPSWNHPGPPCLQRQCRREAAVGDEHAMPGCRKSVWVGGRTYCPCICRETPTAPADCAVACSCSHVPKLKFFTRQLVRILAHLRASTSLTRSSWEASESLLARMVTAGAARRRFAEGASVSLTGRATGVPSSEMVSSPSASMTASKASLSVLTASAPKAAFRSPTTSVAPAAAGPPLSKSM